MLEHLLIRRVDSDTEVVVSRIRSRPLQLVVHIRADGYNVGARDTSEQGVYMALAHAAEADHGYVDAAWCHVLGGVAVAEVSKFGT